MRSNTVTWGPSVGLGMRVSLAIVMVSSELPELLGMTDRILVLHEGEMVGVVDTQDASEELIMTMATGQRQAA